MAPERQNYHTILSQNCKEIKQLDDRADEVSALSLPYCPRMLRGKLSAAALVRNPQPCSDPRRQIPQTAWQLTRLLDFAQRPAAVIRSGYAAAKVDRARGVRLIIGLRDDVILTVEHAFHRRAWA